MQEKAPLKTSFGMWTTGQFACTVLLMICAGPATADGDETLADLLVEKGVISAEELDEIMKSSEGEATSSESTAPVDQSAPAKEQEQSPPIVKIDYKGHSITSADGRFKAAFGGRLQLDAGGFIDDVTNLGDGFELRRARIKSYGHVFTDWQYKIEFNFDNDLDVPVTDAWVRYNGFKPFTITVGNQKVPFGQQSMTSSNWQVFQERALPDAFIDNGETGRRRLGVVLGSYGEHWNVYWGAFAEGVGLSKASSEDFGTAARLVWAPIAEDTQVLTFGGSVDYRIFNGPSALRISSQPESHIAGVRLVDTGVLQNERDHVLFNFETSMVHGPFHAQAEYTGSSLRRRGLQDLYFQGYYVQAGWFITGESRNYDVKSGKYKRPAPKRTPLGAWEVAARWSSIDLQNKEIRGGRENNFTAGLNWWTNRSIMFRFNYVYGMLRPNTTELSPGGIDEDIHAFSARMQIVF